jgi:hypothetical protein
MEAVRRRVRRGKEYDDLFPKPNGINTVIKKSADVQDTVSFIQRLVPLTLGDTKKAAKLLKGKTLEDTCSNIWHFVYKHIPYKKDETGIEQIRRPCRSWWDTRDANLSGTGIDCDCYSVLISSLLMASSPPIPHKYRITKYRKYNGETPYWQHIYIVVPKNERDDYELKQRDEYITMDCVKDEYDDEQPYLEKKDYNMRLDYLNGLDTDEFEVPNSADAQDMAAIYDEEELGKIGQWIKKAAKNVVKAAGKVVKVVAKVSLSPLRNGLLLGMKTNIMKVGSKLRFAYLTDAQAAKLNMNPAALAALRKVKDKVEKIYKGAGGSPDALRLAVLNGKANKDKKVPLAGFSGFGAVYADEEEYNILHSVSGLGELGNPAFIAAAMGAIKMIASSLNSVKGLFKPGTKEASETDAPIDTSAEVDTSSITDSGDEESITTTNNDTKNTDSSALPAVSNNTTGSRVATLTAATKVASNTAVAADTENKAAESGGIVGWVKENPLLTAGAVAGTAAVAYLIFRKKEVKGVAGIPGRRKKAKPKTKAKKKTGAKTGKIKALMIK